MSAWILPCVVGYLILSAIRRWVRVDGITSKYIVITGCDSGLGNLLAQRLDMLGCHVFAACLTDGARTRLQLVTSHRLKAFVMDVTNADHVRNGVEFVRRHLPDDTGIKKHVKFLYICQRRLVEMIAEDRPMRNGDVQI